VAGTAPRDPGLLTRRLFLAGVSVVYALAFVSLAAQVRGLYGAHGIVPLAQRMELLAEHLSGLERLRAPTLLWLGAGDGVLVGLCLAGAASAVLALAGIAPRAALATCWALYLSFVSVGSPFLDFQWDVLLLETGLLAVLWAPGGLRPRADTEAPPSGVVRLLLGFLLFKLLVLSGAVKLLSGDPSWRDGTALTFHYWTQPLPHRGSVLAARAPLLFQQASTLVMFVVELGLPWLLLVPLACRRLRALVAAGTAFLMLCVFLTGNYGFFNLLTAVLAIPLLDDRAWARLLRRAPPEPRPAPAAPRWRAWGLGLAAAPIALLSLASFLEELGLLERPPAPLAALEEAAAPFRSVNGYGLFRVMTKERQEITIEGTRDGLTWEPFLFRYKPDDPARAPVFAGLHMPRLDWQMWFAALDSPRSPRTAWVGALLERLLEGSPEVQGLLRASPFPGPPRAVRATIASWRLAGPKARAHGLWWERGPSRVYLAERARR